MEITYIIIIALLFVAVAVLSALYALQSRRTRELDLQLGASTDMLHGVEQARDAAVAACDTARAQREAEQMARIKAETELEAERRAAREREAHQQDIERMMREQFRAMAGDIMGEQSRRFKEENRESMDLILKPFKDNIMEFRARVENIFSHQNEQQGALKSELQRLMELNSQITTETTNLTNALKGNSKVQGDWGETILETILDYSGLVKGINYEVQSTVAVDESRNVRPDVVVRLPGRQNIIIDSKVSLTDYLRYNAAESPAERSAALKAHLQSVRRHVAELGSKEYHTLKESPDFVVMFIPNEPAFIEALRADNEIWSDAYKKKVVISSPSNIFALLKLVSILWTQDAQQKNQQKILQLSASLYDKMCLVTESIDEVGKNLDRAQKKYDELRTRMQGKGGVISLGEKIKALGVSPRKELAEEWLRQTDMTDDANLLNEENEEQA